MVVPASSPTRYEHPSQPSLIITLQLAQAMPFHQLKPRVSRLFVKSRSPRDRSTLESPRLARRKV